MFEFVYLHNQIQECLEKIKNEDYQIIFLDHMMPKLDGIETLHKMQKQEELVNGIISKLDSLNIQDKKTLESIKKDLKKLI